MKYGKIYTFENMEEAKCLIGKEIAYSDYYANIVNGVDLHIGKLERLSEHQNFPFGIKTCYSVTGVCAQFIREIEEEEKPERMTNRQLSEWCLNGKGHLKRKGRGLIFFACEYEENSENNLVSEEILIRPLGSDNWVEPTVDIYNRDCKDWYQFCKQ